ncbi:MAG: hypothetical protein IJU23_03430 [Proteobacteria bacterium]|nr:hypothetical protein [Pseudomonadota bacterium]
MVPLGANKIIAQIISDNRNTYQHNIPDPYILAGPHFSLDEPWKISQFNEALVGKNCGFHDVKAASQIETTQGKTIKTEVGKIYYLEVKSNESDIDHRAFIGFRRLVDDKKDVEAFSSARLYSLFLPCLLVRRHFYFL